MVWGLTVTVWPATHSDRHSRLLPEAPTSSLLPFHLPENLGSLLFSARPGPLTSP